MLNYLQESSIKPYQGVQWLTSAYLYGKVDAGAAIKACLQKEIKKACSTAMKVNTPEFEKRMEMVVINNDASNTVISVNSLNFQIMVSDLTEEVKPLTNFFII